jgi:hypothetical protein
LNISVGCLLAKRPLPTALASLAPARVIDFRIDVRVEAVFPGLGHIPACLRLLLDEADAHDALDALEAVFPGHHETNRRAVRIRQRLAVKAHREDRQRVGGFGDGQSFAVRPLEHRPPLAGHAHGIVQRLERNVLGLRGRLVVLHHVGKRNSDPRDHHRPGFDATHPVDALLEVERFDEVVEMERAGLLGMTVDRDAPGPWLEILRVLGRVILGRAEFPEIVVSGYVVEAGRRLVGAELALAHIREFRKLALRYDRAEYRRSERYTAGCRSCRHELPAVQVIALTRDLRGPDI